MVAPKGMEVQFLSRAQSMKKVIILILVIVILGVGYWLISPFFIDKKVSEANPFQSAPVEVNPMSNGQFEGFDRIHYGSGTVSLFDSGENYIIRFEDDFNVANGPDLYVGLGKNGEYIKGSEIAKLKGNIGSQNYSIPKDLFKDSNEIWIWCRAFSVGFAKAPLR